MAVKGVPRGVMIVSQTDKGASFITDMLDPIIYNPVIVAKSAGEARRFLIDKNYDLVIINAPLSDENGHELAVYVTERSYSGIMLLVKNEIYDESCYKLENYGIVVLSKPISQQLFNQTLKAVTAIRVKIEVLESENNKLRVKLEELRIVNRAKWALIEYLKMSESQAHKYIEKQAMDMRITKTALAENILKIYESDNVKER